MEFKNKDNIFGINIRGYTKDIIGKDLKVVCWIFMEILELGDSISHKGIGVSVLPNSAEDLNPFIKFIFSIEDKGISKDIIRHIKTDLLFEMIAEYEERHPSVDAKTLEKYEGYYKSGL